jgi:hypothetical protein
VKVQRLMVISGEEVVVTFRKFSHHYTAVTDGRPRLKIKLEPHGRFVCRAKGKAGKVDGSKPAKAFARGLNKFWGQEDDS